MSWIDFLWPMVTGACVTLGLIHLWIGSCRRPGSAHLLFALNALVVAVYSYFEHALTRADSPGRYLALLRWLDFAATAQVVSVAGFVWAFFGTGRKWLAYLACGLACAALTLDFLPEPRLVFVQLTGIRRMETSGGATYSVADGVRNPWNAVFYLGVVLLVVFVADASVCLWRRGERRRAWVVGGAITFFVLAGGLLAALVDAGVLQTPYLLTFAYLAIVVAMGLELNNEVLRAAQLACDLDESERRMTLAADAIGLGVWIRDLNRNEIWASVQWRSMFGFSKTERLELDGILQRIHSMDRDRLRLTLANVVERGSSYNTEYRILLADGDVRWMTSHGSVECDRRGKPAIVRSVSFDITARRQAELELQEQRVELAHLSRVSVLGELAGSIAHELNQPLAAMLSNSQVGRRSLDAGPPDLAEMTAIFDDITEDAKRAGGIIHGMRAMVKKDARVEVMSLDLNQVVNQAASLLHSEILNRKVRVDLRLRPGLPPVSAGRVEIQQVLINLLLNSMDALKACTGPSSIEIVTEQIERHVIATVRDNGPGIPAEFVTRLFEPFASTKPGGLGLGLVISRRIMERFGGELRAEIHPDGGAVFRMVFPLVHGGN